MIFDSSWTQLAFTDTVC